MKTHNKVFLLLIFVFVSQYSFAQNTDEMNHPIYKLEKALRAGDKCALYEIAPYLDSKKELLELLDINHEVSTNESEVAKRILDVSCIFLDDEIKIDSTTSAQDFLIFLNANSEKIIYSKTAAAFLITPLESRDVQIKFREITESRRLTREEKLQEINLIKNTEIKSLINQKNPKALLCIVSDLYKSRDWLNMLWEDNHLILLQALTDFEIALEDKFGKMTWRIGQQTPILNLLCYLAKNYSKFKWNDEKNIFENNEIKIIPVGIENELFQLLSNKNDSIALDAFIRLTTCNSEKVWKLADEEQYKSDYPFYRNFSLPLFPYQFLKQLSILTKYCNINNIDFVGSSELQSKIKKLKSEMSALERQYLEDSLANNLTFESITALEYWTIIYERSEKLCCSTGRILDVFYSQNWTKLLNDERQLLFYLKKSKLFDDLGIIGACNNFLQKFINSPQNVLEQLKNIKTSDRDIEIQIQKILSNDILSNSNKNYKAFIGNKNCEEMN